MIACIRFLNGVQGGQYVLIGTAALLVLCIAFALGFEFNRTRKGAAVLMLALFLALAVCDIVWNAVYFPGGSYKNYGLGGIFGLLLVLLLPIAAFIAAAVNEKNVKE